MGMKCKNCEVELRSLNTRTVNNEYILRKRKCPKCGLEFKTIEITEEAYNDTVGLVMTVSNFIRRSIQTAKKEIEK